MYLSKPQYKAIIECNVGKHDQVPPAIIQFLLKKGLIFETLIGYDLTEKGFESTRQTFEEHQKQKADTRTGPSDKHDFHTAKRTIFTNEDEPPTPKKRRSIESMASIKAKPVTKYKEIK
jgi:hypothetical protein